MLFVVNEERIRTERMHVSVWKYEAYEVQVCIREPSQSTDQNFFLHQSSDGAKSAYLRLSQLFLCMLSTLLLLTHSYVPTNIVLRVHWIEIRTFVRHYALYLFIT